MRKWVVQVVVVVALLLPCMCCMQMRLAWSECHQGNHAEREAEHATCLLSGSVLCGV